MRLLSCIARIACDLLDVLAPRLCPACEGLLHESEIGYCDACRASLEPAPFPRDLFQELVGALGRDELALTSVGALYSFTQDGPVQQLVHAVKYLGCYDLGVSLGCELGNALSAFAEFDRIDAVVPVPLHSARRRERGYNQAEAIARGVAQSRTLDLLPDAMTRAKHTRSQTRLGADQRVANVRQAFRVVAGDVDSRHILLCDDVCTTGATLNACAEALLAQGAHSVAAATVAKDLLTAGQRCDPLPTALYGLS
ncbi:MAG: ComF family protein [bacterium]|nr:ComF family protein [Candidatus Kapabacteria bacterium]